MMTVKQLMNARGRIWREKVPQTVMGVDLLLWTTLEELVSMLELTYNPEEMLEIAPEAAQILERGAAHFEAHKIPIPLPVALVNLRIARFKAGLEDTID